TIADTLVDLVKKFLERVKERENTSPAARSVSKVAHIGTIAGVNVHVVVVAGCSPNYANTRELALELANPFIEERHFCCVLTAGAVVKVNGFILVVHGVSGVPRTHRTTERGVTRTASALRNPPVSGINQRATLSQAGNPALSRSRSQFIHVRVTAKVLNVLGSKHVFVVRQPGRDAIGSGRARATNPATRSEPLGQFDVRHTLNAELVRNLVEVVDDPLLNHRINDKLHGLFRYLLDLIPGLTDSVLALLEGVRDTI